MEFLSSLPENSFPLSQEELVSLCKGYYYNFSGELDLGEWKIFEKILEKIRARDTDDDAIFELSCFMPPGILHKLIVDLEMTISAIKATTENTFTRYGAFYLIIPLTRLVAQKINREGESLQPLPS